MKEQQLPALTANKQTEKPLITGLQALAGQFNPDDPAEAKAALEQLRIIHKRQQTASK